VDADLYNVTNINNKSVLKTKIMDFLKNYGNIVILCLVILIMSFLNPRFMSLRNFINLSKQIVGPGILSLGLMFVIISGGIDLSAGFGVSLVSVVFALMYETTSNIIIAIIIAIITGLILGAFNGFIITKLKIVPFVATLSTMLIFQGLTYVLLTGKMAWVRHPFTKILGNGNVFGIPILFLFMITFYIISYIILNYTKIGRYSIAIGSNEEGAILDGISVAKYKFFIYMLSGLFVSITAIIMISRLQLATPTIGGLAILMDAIAATIIGGTSLAGGKGSVVGTFIGVVIIVVIGNIINFLNIDPTYKDFFKGVVIIGVLFFDRVVNAKQYEKEAK